MPEHCVLKIAVPCPLYGLFDYLLPDRLVNHEIQPGMRVQVPFGRQKLTGIIIEQTDHSELPRSKLKPILALPDTRAVFSAEMIKLLLWAARYYMHPSGGALQTALPVYLRSINNVFAQIEGDTCWRINPGDEETCQHLLRRAPKQHQLYQLLRDHPNGLTSNELNQHTANWRNAIKALLDKSLVTTSQQAFSWRAQAAKNHQSKPVIRLNTEQKQAVDAINQHTETLASKNQQGNYAGIHCLFGVTGSGKTEVYLALASRVLANHQQILLLVPEISLTPQLTQRFTAHLDTPVAVLHSGLNSTQRYAAWYAAGCGEARVVIGTRSSIFTPMPDLGLIIIDEEHDGSYKQQDGFRYNARDLAMVRARHKRCPVVLGSATPSLETLNNINEQRYHVHYIHQRANRRALPTVQLVNLCSQRLHEGLSEQLISKIKQHLQQQGQILLFINRRGFAPLLMCHHCGWTTRCHRCDANMTYHKKHHQLRCHHCGSQRPVPEHCGDCGSREIIAMGSGTERIETFLQTQFPQTRVNRIDRDTTRNKGALQKKLQQAHSGESGILVGTQMLAKGHDFPGVTLVAILDTDQALYSADFRAAEHLAQLITQVSGRAGRAEKPGEVLIQTHHPEHPFLQTLLHQGYAHFAQTALVERKAADLPPSLHLILIRSESMGINDAREFLSDAVAQLSTMTTTQIDLFGPIPAPMERRAGRYRYQLMLQSKQRKPLHQLLSNWLPTLVKLKSARKVRWSIDVDPYDTF